MHRNVWKECTFNWKQLSLKRAAGGRCWDHMPFGAVWILRPSTPQQQTFQRKRKYVFFKPSNICENMNSGTRETPGSFLRLNGPVTVPTWLTRGIKEIHFHFLQISSKYHSSPSYGSSSIISCYSYDFNLHKAFHSIKNILVGIKMFPHVQREWAVC